MPCLEYFSGRRCKPAREGRSKKYQAAAEDTWKASAKFLKSGSYRMRTVVRNYTLPRKPKTWSLVSINSDPQDLTEAEFGQFAEQWRRDTFFHSSLSKKFTHPAYVTIMAGGKSVLPFILKDLENNPDHWFYALRYIVRKDVASGAANFDDARAAWLDWGRTNNYI